MSGIEAVEQRVNNFFRNDTQLGVKTKYNYQQIIKRYALYCTRELKDPYLESTFVDYLHYITTENKNSKSYTRLNYLVIRNYFLRNEITVPLFSSLKLKFTKNKYDLQGLTKDEVLEFLRTFYFRPGFEDVFLMFLVQASCGLRFIETKQLTGQDVYKLLMGETIEICSAKTFIRDTITMMSEYRAMDGYVLIDNRSIGKVALDILNHGILNGAGTLVNSESTEKLFTKTYESYRQKFNRIKQTIVKRGTGLFNGIRTTRGMGLHVGRRSFASEVMTRVSNLTTNDEERMGVTSRALRHVGTSSTRRYLQPSERGLAERLQEIF